jgi:hypothetical protein
MRVTFKYHGYDDQDHEVTEAWATETPMLAVFMAGRSFERAVRAGEQAEPAWGHQITVTVLA